MAKKQSTGFGNRLRELRAAAGLSQAALAEKAGMHLHGLTKLEQGLREPSWATVQSLATAMKVSCEAFAGVEPDASDPEKRPRGRPVTPDDSAELKPAPKKGKK